MGADIDQLNIKIEADAQKAHSSVDTLINKLGRLNAALGGINTSNLASLSNGIQRLSSSMQSMKNVGTADFTRLAKNIQKMGSLDANSLSNAAGSIHRFVNALGTIDKINVSDNAAQIGQLAKGISQLGYKSSTQAIENIPKLATAMRQLMTELSKAPRVSQNLIQMTEALAKLGRTGASSGRAATSLGRALDSYTASTGRASRGTFSLASALGKMYATYWLLFRAFGKIGEAIDISSDLTEVQNVVDVTFGNMAYKVEEFAKTSIQQLGMSELSLKQYASRFQAMGSAMGISGASIGNANSFLNKQTNGYIGLSDSMSDVSLNLTKLTADMASFYNVEQKVVAEDLEAIFTGMTRPLRTYGLDLTEATLKEWAMKNGLDANIDSMTQAEKTMLRYQYVMANTGAAQGDFARTANTWANQVRILKQNFQQLASVIGGVFINALKPLVSALNAAMSHIIAFAETISNALGKIFGWKYESGGGGMTTDFGNAADSADDIADSTGTAAKNIEKMQAGLRAFDELKTIDIKDSSSDTGSGGSGSGGASGGGSSGGQWVEQDSMFDTFKSDIDSLYELGEYIGKTLTDAMNSIDWDSVYEGARNFGKGLADFLNGLISPELFGAVGRTIAGALNTAIYAALSFGETFDWSDFGLSIATGINEFFKTFDFKALAQTINTWVQGIWTTIKTAISNIDWKNIWKGIKDFLSEIDIETVDIILGSFLLKQAGKILTGTALKNIILKKLGLSSGKFTIYAGVAVLTFTLTTYILSHAKEWIDNLKEKLGNLIVGSEDVHYNGEDMTLETPLKWKIKDLQLDFGDFKHNLYLAFEEWKSGIEFDFSDVFSFEWTSYFFSDAKKAFENAFDSNSFMDIGYWIVEGILDGFVGAITFIFEPIYRFFEDVYDGICTVFGIASPAKEMKPIGEYILLGIVEGFSDKVSEFNTAISTWFDESVKPWFTKEKWEEIGNGIKDGLSTKWDEFNTWWGNTGVPEWWNNNVAPWFTVEKWQELGDNAKKALSDKWNEFTTWWKETGIYKWWNDNVKPWFTKDKWTSVSNGMKDGLEAKWNEFSSWWKSTGIYSWWNNNVAPYFTKDKWNFSGIKDGLSTAWNAAIDSIKSIWNNFASWLNSKLTFNITNPITGSSSSMSLGSLPTFAVGGFPEDGLFMANHGELVGKFANGKTAVANNDQITQGIADAVYPAVYNAVSAAMRNNGGGSNVTLQVEGDPNGMFRIIQKQANEYTGRTGRPAFDF